MSNSLEIKKKFKFWALKMIFFQAIFFHEF